jgi:catechol 2,3-dioxygenase-like lactoylglutathione lyase family enzyme
MTILGLDHVQLAAPAGGEDDARAFYGGVLGMREIPKPVALQGRGGVWFVAGAHEVHVGIEESFAPARKAHPALLVSHGVLDELAGRLAGAGHAVEWDRNIPERRRFYVADPFGNRLEITEPSTGPGRD